MTATITTLDPSDEAALIAWNDLLRRGFAEGHEALSWRGAETTVAQFAPNRPDSTSVALLAQVDGEPVGGAEANVRADAPLGLLVSVLPDFRRRGLGRALVEAVRAALPQAETARASTFSDEGVAFAQAAGLSVGIRQARQLLDWPPSPSTVDALARPVPGLEVRSWEGRCPDDMIADVVALTQQMREDVPAGALTRTAKEADVAEYRENEEWREAAGYRALTSLAILDGRPAGYTEIYVKREAPAIALQNDTLVERSVRGRGVGRALKVANLRRLSDCPEAHAIRWVQSYTAVENEPMRALNQAIGFRVADVMTVLEGPLRSA